MTWQRAVRKLTAALLALAAAWLAGAGAEASPTYISLEDAWALAEEHHPRMVEARRSLAQLQRDLQQRENAYAPTLNMSVGGLEVRRDLDGDWRAPNPRASLSASLKLPAGFTISVSATSPSLTPPSTGSNNWRGSFSVEYPLFRSPELDSDAQALRQAQQALSVAMRELEQLRDEVRAGVLAAMQAEQIAAVRLQLAYASYDDAVASWETTLRQMELGMVTEAEYLSSQVSLLRAEQERLSAERAWQARRRELGDMLGLQDPFAYEFENVLTITAMPDPGAADTAAERAVASSLTVWERQRAVESAELQLASERERSGLTAQLRGQYVPAGSGSGQQQQEGFQVSLTLSYPLYDAGQRRMSLEAREEAVQRAREQLAQAEQDVRARVADLLVQIEDARRDVEIASLDLRRVQLELAAVLRQAELAVAAVGEEDVERARRNVVRSELAYLEAVQRYQARWIELQRLQGPVPWEQLLATAAGEEARQ